MALRRGQSRDDFSFPAAPTSAPAAPQPGAPAPLTTQLGSSGQTIEDKFAAQRAGGTDKYRDPAYSQAQWGAWEEEERNRVRAGTSANQQGNCPPDKPFTSRPGPSGETSCTEKPDDCPPGTTMHGSGCVRREDLPAWAGGGGGGGGAGGGGDAGPGPSGGGDPSGLSGMMETNLKKMLAGGDSRYSPQAMQGLLAQIKQRIESSKSTQLRQAQEEAAGRGMSRSGRTGTNLAAIRRGAESEFTDQYANVLKAKIDADRQDKLDALDRSQKYLDSMRDELYRRDMSAIQRQQFKANLDLAYANIANQRSMLSQSQQHARDMLGAQYGYSAVFGG